MRKWLNGLMHYDRFERFLVQTTLGTPTEPKDPISLLGSW